MLTTNVLLDAAKQAASIGSDYRLARTIGASDNTLYNWRHGISAPDERYSLKLAELSKIYLPYVLNCMAAARAKDPALKAGYEAAAASLAALDPSRTVDILSKQLRTPDRLETPINKRFGTMGLGSAILYIVESKL